MFTIKTKAKMLKAQFVHAMTRNRYVGSYPKFKRFVLVNFLFVVIGFVGWNISLQAPEISVKWDRGPIILENPALASNMKPSEVVEEKEIEITDCNSAVDVMAKKYGASPVLLKKIVEAESGNNEKAANGTSSARGCFQFIIGTWEEYGRRLWGDDFYEKNRYNPEHNVELASWMIGELGELSHWDASKHNWK